jgi:magnesium chelatase subunit D
VSPFDPAWEAPPPLSDAVYAAALLAVDAKLGGIAVRSWSGPLRNHLIRQLAALAPAAGLRKLPLGISDERLLGGLDLTATLAAGRAVSSTGLLAESEGGFLVLAMAERLSPGTAARIAAALDDGRRIRIIALDEGIGPDEAPPAALLDRLAFTIADLPAETDRWPEPSAITCAQQALPDVLCPPEAVAQLCALAAMLGIASTRAELFALRAARAAAALRASTMVEAADIALAARLVLAPRAMQIPQSAEPPPEAPEDPPEPENEQTEQQEQDPQTLEDKIDEAARAVLPEQLLAALAAAGPRRMARGAGKSGVTHSLKRGRPVAARRGALTGHARLSLLDTLRAAAPWQRLRQPGGCRRIAVRAEDFHIKRFREKPRNIAIFAVDASGSSALNRLAEAKGAILLLLADCYVQRDEVALIAFRGQSAELLLPPTHALARVRRALAALPGGGPTPLASGIAAARLLAEHERRAGKQPLLVILTDGGANIGQDGKPGRAAAGADALAAAKACAAQHLSALVVDTAPRRQPFVAQLAGAMAAKYFPLPYADAQRLAQAVQAQGGAYARSAA